MKALEYIKLISEEEIARRYFIMNSFDGALTILGVLIGMYTAGVTESRVIIISCLGVAVAMAVSGIWGAYTSERAERLKDLRHLEEHMLMDLGKTKVGREVQLMSVLIALVNSLSPLAVSLVLISPFMLAQAGIFSLAHAFTASAALTAAILFLIGAFVGSIGKDNILKSGIKMLFAGILVGVLVFIIEGLSVV